MRRAGPVGEEEASAAALSGLPGMGPATLVTLLRRWSPSQAWALVRSGEVTRLRPGGAAAALGARAKATWAADGRRSRPEKGEPADAAQVVSAKALSGQLSFAEPPALSQARMGDRPDRSWADVALRFDPLAWWARTAARGIGVTWLGRPDYPGALAGDPHPPGVIFWRGSMACLERPVVAIVGTRHATVEGRAVAFELGRGLAAAGVCVLSGLALGIDGAAHTGALASRDGDGWAGPVGVAASGVDVPYPRRHARLWEDVCEAGAVLSETLPGQPAQAWRFPSRNRVIAGLARMVVVVESHEAGGSLITAEAAIERGIDVRAVPGPVRSPASAGTNQLLYDGAGPVRHVRDVLDGLGVFLSDGDESTGSDRSGRGGAEGTVRLSAECRTVLAAVGRRPTALNQVVRASSMAVAAVARALDELEAAGLVRQEGGWWAIAHRSGPS